MSFWAFLALHLGKFKPKVEVGKKCPCGFKYNEDVSHCESYTVNIHQYQPNNNSRDGSQLQEDGLVRVSAFKMRQKPSDTVHFVTVDLLNAYIGNLCRSQTENIFIQGLNELNESRGKPRPIPKDVFYTAVSIFLHAVSYDSQEGFGCDQCPALLQPGEREEEFSDIEAHIM